MEAKELRKSVQKIYSNLDFYKFCEFIAIAPDEYGVKKWNEFQKLSSAIAQFDDEKLQKIIDYGGAK